MGLWHKPWQVALTIKKLQNDWSKKEIFQFESDKGWTDAFSLDAFWENTKDRIQWLTGKHWTTFIHANTKNYQLTLKYYKDMAKKKVKVEDSDREILKKASHEDVIKIIKIFKDENEKFKNENDIANYVKKHLEEK